MLLLSNFEFTICITLIEHHIKCGTFDAETGVGDKTIFNELPCDLLDLNNYVT